MPDLNTLIKHKFEKLANIKTRVPDGYVFVPKGDVYITRHCRDETSAAGKTLFVVFDPQTKQRVGLRCPRNIYEDVCTRAEVTASSRQKAVKTKDKRDIDAARETLVRLFPRMPLAHAQQVLDHGFLKGSGRVGRAMKLDDDHRCTLAVVAYARHMMTPYDSLLKKLQEPYGRTKGREKAREIIREALASALKGWKAPMVDLRVLDVEVPDLTKRLHTRNDVSPHVKQAHQKSLKPNVKRSKVNSHNTGARDLKRPTTTVPAPKKKQMKKAPAPPKHAQSKAGRQKASPKRTLKSPNSKRRLRQS